MTGLTLRRLLTLLVLVLLLPLVVACSGEGDEDEPVDDDDDDTVSDDDDDDDENDDDDDVDGDSSDGDEPDGDDEESSDGDVDGDDSDGDEEVEDGPFSTIFSDPMVKDGVVTEDDPIHVYHTFTWWNIASRAWTQPLNPDRQLIGLLQQAQHRIHAAVYSLDLPEVSLAFLQAHQAGLEVQLVMESDYRDDPAVDQLVEAGIPLVLDERDGSLMHNKFIVVDDTIVWTGSTNLTENGVWNNNNHAIMLYSPEMAGDFEDEFQEMFTEGAFSTASLDNAGGSFQVGETGLELYFSPDEGRFRQQGIRDRMISLVDGAQESIEFCIFAFTADDLANAIIDAHERGVAVRGVMDEYNAASDDSEYSRLLNAGVNVILDRNRKSMHHKFMVVDGEVTVLGSYNWTNAAETKNDENILFVHDERVAESFLMEVERVWLME